MIFFFYWFRIKFPAWFFSLIWPSYYSFWDKNGQRKPKGTNNQNDMFFMALTIKCYPCLYNRTSHIGFLSITSVSSPLVNHLTFIHKIQDNKRKAMLDFRFWYFFLPGVMPLHLPKTKTTCLLLTHSSIFIIRQSRDGLCDWVWWAAGVHTGFRTITLVLNIGSLPNLATLFPCGRGRTLFILGSLGQKSRSPLL